MCNVEVGSVKELVATGGSCGGSGEFGERRLRRGRERVGLNSDVVVTVIDLCSDGDRVRDEGDRRWVGGVVREVVVAV